MTLFYEDFEVGDTREFGERTVTKAEMIEFAERYDPQPFHVDEQAAKESTFGGLIASGWHTGAVTMRLLVDGLLSEAASMGARGLDELRWLRPVRPGDTLSCRTEVLEKWPARDAPDRGYVRYELVAFNQHDEAVMSWTALGLFGRSDPGEPASDADEQ